MSDSRAAFKKMMAEVERKNAIVYAQVADDVIADLSADDIEAIKLNPRPIDYHFGLCLYIRNKYIHSGAIELTGEPDHMSGEIMRIIIRKLLPEYEPYPLLFNLFEHDAAFVSTHRYAFVKPALDRYFSTLQEVYHQLKEAAEIEDATPPDYDWDNGMELLNEEEYEAAKKKSKRLRTEALMSIAEDLWGFDGYEKRAQELGVSEKAISEAKTFCKEALQADWLSSIFVPGSILLLPAYDKLSKDERISALEDIGIFLDQWPRDILDKMPESAFIHREVAEYVLKKNGSLLSKMPKWRGDKELVMIAIANRYSAIEHADKSLSDDREVLRAAFENASYSILSDEPYSKYSDDDEFVWLAVMSYPTNLCYASQRLKDNKDLVLAAIKNTDHVGVSNFYKDLSESMQEDEDVVLAVATCPSVPYEFPPEKYRDDDEVGRLLADESLHGDHFTLIKMSQRIKEKWMSEEELEHWGG